MPVVRAQAEQAVIGRLEDGTPYFAPLGELWWDPEEDRVMCHLCGRWFRFFGSSHLYRTHAWTLGRYREAFHLRGNVPTCSEQLSAVHRADAKRRIDADQFGARYLPPAGRRRVGVVPRWRSLAVRHPELVEQLHPERNGQIDPLSVAAGSNRKLWWRCAAGHEWQATVHNRTAGWGCPVCSAPAHARRLRALARAQARVPAERSLAVKRPELVAELHPTRNGTVDPNAIGYGSRRKLWWCCHCGHEWRATVSSRAIKGSGCRRCFLERHARQLAERNRTRPPTVPIARSLAVRHPELVAELHPTMNGELDPYAIGSSSHRRLWWRCPAGHQWQTSVNTRARGCRCPICARRRAGRLHTGAPPRHDRAAARPSVSARECVAALAEFIRTFGEIPTTATYREFALGSDRPLPTLDQIRSSCRTIGGWRGAVQQASRTREAARERPSSRTQQGPASRSASAVRASA
jgi:hypothetical protein